MRTTKQMTSFFQIFRDVLSTTPITVIILLQPSSRNWKDQANDIEGNQIHS